MGFGAGRWCWDPAGRTHSTAVIPNTQTSAMWCSKLQCFSSFCMPTTARWSAGKLRSHQARKAIFLTKSCEKWQQRDAFKQPYEHKYYKAKDFWKVKLYLPKIQVLQSKRFWEGKALPSKNLLLCSTCVLMGWGIHSRPHLWDPLRGDGVAEHTPRLIIDA